MSETDPHPVLKWLRIARPYVVFAFLAFLIIRFMLNEAESERETSRSTSGVDNTVDLVACEDLVPDLIEAVESRDIGVQLLKVRNPLLVNDYQASVQTPDRGYATVLSCKGVGVFSTNEDYPIRFKAVLDSDGDMLVRLETIE